jgi:hypothetical protein
VRDSTAHENANAFYGTVNRGICVMFACSSADRSGLSPITSIRMVLTGYAGTPRSASFLLCGQRLGHLRRAAFQREGSNSLEIAESPFEGLFEQKRTPSK